ncbi:glutamine--fructose-6-phosphate transaminase (isomerizing) [bacterium TMED181]|nr:glutamine--fructose-6-phosphate transaminase (isomerizing) [Planctomycetota bacterium]OUW45811.1 MAG: glutamine--fructose-6-phosphate transaminase (isomerizing) [bacterium TMED181]
MCGIFGISADHNVAPVLIESLERLEYRGYDSCGLSIGKEDGHLEVRKGAGPVQRVATEERFAEASGNWGLGHVRWATHGRVSRLNAHPLVDSFGDISIVHNGILQDYESLRAELTASGHTFLSETDSEVIAHLLERCLKDSTSIEEAVLACAQKLQGTYAIGVMTRHEPGVLYALRNESPLLVGVGDDFHCFSSDPLTLGGLTDQVIWLEDGEMARIDRESCRLRSITTGSEIQRSPETVSIATRAVELSGHPDFMSKEITENSQVVKTAWAIEESEIDRIVEVIQQSERTVLTGVGTSYYVALMGQYMISELADEFTPAMSSDEMPHMVPLRDSDHVLAISQSGETYDTLRALRISRARGANLSAILNVDSSSMAREVDQYLDQGAGPEICVLSTKSTISQLALMLRIAVRLGEMKGVLQGEKLAAVLEDMSALPERLESIAKGDHTIIRDLARRHSVMRNWFFLGRGIQHGLALESALKFKEVTYCHAEGMSSGALKHGTISLIDDAMHTVIFLPGTEVKDLRQHAIGAIAEISTRGGKVICFQPEGSPTPEPRPDSIVECPAAGPWTTPLLQLMQAQLFAYYTAKALGRNVDKPRALAKSVTVG